MYPLHTAMGSYDLINDLFDNSYNHFMIDKIIKQKNKQIYKKWNDFSKEEKYNLIKSYLLKNEVSIKIVDYKFINIKFDKEKKYIKSLDYKRKN